MQSRNGGWGSFDADNTHYYLNHIPFADHGALLDPPTADVSARCLGLLAQLGYGADHPAVAAAIAYLRREQEADGSWFGRWGTNYIYGTWSVLAAVNAAGIDPAAPEMRRAVDWLLARQRADGGWGEAERIVLARAAARRGALYSTASQTAWALLALMAAGEVRQPGGGARHRLSDCDPELERKLGRAVVHRGRLSARFLSALSRLPRLFSALGFGPLPPSDKRRIRPGCRSVFEPWVGLCSRRQDRPLRSASAGSRRKRRSRAPPAFRWWSAPGIGAAQPRLSKARSGRRIV